MNKVYCRLFLLWLSSWVSPVCLDAQTTVDVDLQEFLVDRLSTLTQAQSGIDGGRVIVVETETGAVKCFMDFVFTSDGLEVKPDVDVFVSHPSALICPLVLFAAFQSGRVFTSDTVDTGNGVLHTREGLVVRDENFRRGGNGNLPYSGALVKGSNIAVFLAAQTAFRGDAAKLYDYLIDIVPAGDNIVCSVADTLNFDCPLRPESSDYITFADIVQGRYSMSLPRILASYNVIVCGNDASAFTFVPSPRSSLNDAKLLGCDAVKEALEEHYDRAVRAYRLPPHEEMSGYGAFMEVASNECFLDFFGWYPRLEPQYSFIISLHAQSSEARLRTIYKIAPLIAEYFEQQ